MKARHLFGLPAWAVAAPLLAAALVPFTLAHLPVPSLIVAAGLVGAVLAAVHHAEVVAHKVGEPFGTLLLALAVTLIEVALIVTLMLTGTDDDSPLARDTVFAAVMIILNGIIGLAMLVGGVRHGEQKFRITGTSASLAALAALTVLTLVLPNFTTTLPGPYYSHPQLGFVAVVSIALYLAFVMVQTVRHREYFLPAEGQEEAHAAPPAAATTAVAGVLLLIGLAAVVLLGKALAADVEDVVVRYGLPKAIVAVLIAVIVLLPEGLAAIRAARANRLQTSLNLALGSALASIGLTIPAVSIVAIAGDFPLRLGLLPMHMVLLSLSLFTAALSLSTGRSTVLQGAVHLTIFAVYLFTVAVP